MQIKEIELGGFHKTSSSLSLQGNHCCAHDAVAVLPLAVAGPPLPQVDKRSRGPQLPETLTPLLSLRRRHLSPLPRLLLLLPAATAVAPADASDCRELRRARRRLRLDALYLYPE